MKYENVRKGTFIERINRFTARIEIENEEILCHVKNTGRCKELFVKGAEVYLEKSDNPNRKTDYSLIGVVKDGNMVNVDSQAPNKMVKEWLEKERKDILYLKPETVFGNSRFDFYGETKDKKIWMEVKGVTLIENGVALFPDAPTERGIKHIEELCKAVEEGFEAWLIFVIQRKDVTSFRPNEKRHAAFAEALRRAAKKGVKVFAYDSIVTEDTAVIDEGIRVEL